MTKKTLEMERKNIVLDENWLTPSALALEEGVDRATVSGWIKRNQIDYFVLPGAATRKHMVDRRTSPGKRRQGWHRKKAPLNPDASK